MTSDFFSINNLKEVKQKYNIFPKKKFIVNNDGYKLKRVRQK